MSAEPAGRIKFDLVSIFPAMVQASLADGVVGRAIGRGIVDVAVHDLRDFTTDRHRVVDDMPFGGGPGMVMKPEPFFAAVERIRDTRGTPGTIVLTSPDGERFSHRHAERLSGLRTRGVPLRPLRRRRRTCAGVSGGGTLSVGDYVLSGGELPALVMLDAVARLVPGVVGDEESVARDSFMRGLLDYPQYTRPATFQGHEVPAVLLSGHHAAIAKWRRREALAQDRGAAAGPAGVGHAGRGRPGAAGRDSQGRKVRHGRRANVDSRGLTAVADSQVEGSDVMTAVETVERGQMVERPAMKPGDTVRVHVKVREGDKERIQVFEGMVIGMHRGGARATFTVRKVSFGQGVERIFPLHSPIIDRIEVTRSARVRRAKLYFLRDLKGKAARMKEQKKA